MFPPPCGRLQKVRFGDHANLEMGRMENAESSAVVPPGGQKRSCLKGARMGLPTNQPTSPERTCMPRPANYKSPPMDIKAVRMRYHLPTRRVRRPQPAAPRRPPPRVRTPSPPRAQTPPQYLPSVSTGNTPPLLDFDAECPAPPPVEVRPPTRHELDYRNAIYADQMWPLEVYQPNDIMDINPHVKAPVMSSRPPCPPSRLPQPTEGTFSLTFDEPSGSRAGHNICLPQPPQPAAQPAQRRSPSPCRPAEPSLLDMPWDNCEGLMQPLQPRAVHFKNIL